MENLNAEQIKKALECCHKESIVLCRECPYTKEYNEFCANKLMKDALAIITSQEQRIGAQDMTISELRQRAEKAAHDASRYEQRINELTEDLHATRTELTQNLHECKADTVRKMQERFALRYGTYTDKDMTPITEVFWLLDQIAKEMLESGDG